VVERLLSSPEEREERGRRGREAVLAGHTFAHRVDQLLEILAAHGCEPRRVKPVAAAPSPVEPAREHRRRRFAPWSWRSTTPSDGERRAPSAARRRRG
jgi:Glycosyl transferases group 1